MFTQLLQYNDIGLLLLRLVIASIFLYHSLPKLKNAKEMAQGIGFSTEFVTALGLVEFLSSVGLILGVYTQLWALLLSIVMIGALYMKIVRWNIPFSASNKTGLEFDLILLAANVVILFGGGGSIRIL